MALVDSESVFKSGGSKLWRKCNDSSHTWNRFQKITQIRGSFGEKKNSCIERNTGNQSHIHLFATSYSQRQSQESIR